MGLASKTPPVEALAGFRIRPPDRSISVNWRELWQHRELLYFLVWRDLKVRYKQTVLGVVWAVLQPVLTTIVFTIIFGRLAKLSSDGVPYPVFTLAALLPWQLFMRAVGTGSQSLVANQNLITKVYFPRLLIPMASIAGGVVDFGIGLLILFAMMIYYRVTLSWAFMALPLFFVLTLVVSLGVSLWLAALNVRFRDVAQIIPFLTQIWFYATPIAYSISLVPSLLLPLYGLNPMVGVIEGFRWSLFGQSPDALAAILISIVVSLVLLVTGLAFFQRVEDTFADVV
jgi:lipopolysaccharide transport system permease protein